MRILQVNKFWYPRGGDCVVAMATAALLRRMGHDVAAFAMTHPMNVADPHLVGCAAEVDFGGGRAAQLRAMRRAMGGVGVREAFTHALDEFAPDVVHLHNIHSQLSPAVAMLAHQRGCRVVWTMHDYKLLCPAYTCLRDGQPCTLCVTHPLDVVNRRCMKHSLPASVAALLEATRWNRERLLQWVHTFICPSEFMAGLLREGDIPADRIAVIPNWMPRERMSESPVVLARGRYGCYVGRLSPEKGVDWLVDAARASGTHLKIAGDGPLLDSLRRRCASQDERIEILGRLDAAGVAALLAQARFSVVPSLWWENCPMGIIESLCAGTPVVGTRMGGIPQLLEAPDSTSSLTSCGALVPAGDTAALASALASAATHRWDHPAIARRAHARFDEHSHYRALMQVYRQ